MAQVTSIEKMGRRLIVTLDNAEKFNISYSMMSERPLETGEEIDIEEYDNWVMVHQYRDALNYAVSLLAMRDHSTGEVRAKLRHRGYRENTCQMVLYKLEKENLMDDGNFAVTYVDSRKNGTIGSGRMRQELRRKGISGEEAESALERISTEEETESAVTVVKKCLSRVKAGDTPQKIKARTMGTLARRGFSYSIAAKAYERVMNEEED